MGKGTELAASLGNEEAARLIDDLKDQLLIAFLKRLGGSVEMSFSEVDATGDGDFAVAIDAEAKVLRFTIVKKALPPPAPTGGERKGQ